MKNPLDELEKILIKLTTQKDSVVKLAEEFPLKEDNSIIVSFEPALEVGASAMVNGVPAPEGDAELDNGVVVTMDAKGTVTAIKEPVVSEPEPVDSAPVEPTFNAEEAIGKLSKEFNEMKALLKLSVENSISLSKELEVVKKLPASTPLEKPNYFKENLQKFNK